MPIVRHITAVGLALLLALGAAQTHGTALRSSGVPSLAHVFVIVMENRESSRVLGNSAAPYINELAAQYSLAANYYGVSHPSLPNYLALAAGNDFGVTSDCTDCFLDRPNIADQLEAVGRTWRAYQESMPTPCLLGDSGMYAQRHNPFIYFDSIRLNPERCAAGIVPFERLATDLEQGVAPDFAFITPNGCNDGHDCPTEVADAWLRQVVPTILASTAYQNGGLLIITWDEGSTVEGCCGGLARGGKVVTILISPLIRLGFVSEVPASHYHLMRTIEDGFGLPPLGRAADVSPMAEYFD